MDREEIGKIKNAAIKIHNGDYVAGLNILFKLVGWGDYKYPGHPRSVQRKDAADVCKDCGCEIGTLHKYTCQWGGRGNIYHG